MMWRATISMLHLMRFVIKNIPPPPPILLDLAQFILEMELFNYLCSLSNRNCQLMFVKVKRETVIQRKYVYFSSFHEDIPDILHLNLFMSAISLFLRKMLLEC
jgi:hypothetical protein